MKEVDSLYLGDGLNVEYDRVQPHVVLNFRGDTITLHPLLFGSLLQHGETLTQRYGDPFSIRPVLNQTVSKPFPNAMTVRRALGGHPDDVPHERLEAELFIRQPGIITLLTRNSSETPILKYTALRDYKAEAMTVAIDSPAVVACSLPAYYRHAVGAALVKWVIDNQDALMAYWRHDGPDIYAITKLKNYEGLDHDARIERGWARS